MARTALIRRLDEIEMDQSLLRRPGSPKALDLSPLRGLAYEFEQLGDHVQALRAQRLYAVLQQTAWDRAARLTQARLERETGQLAQSARTLATLRGTLADPGDESLRHWQGVNLGCFIAEEHYTLTRALADANLPEEAQVTLAAADSILGELSGAGATAVRELAEDVAERVRDPRDLG
ncbi:hypothetical protein ACRAWF_23505 [Streptomyces sp. L7]